MKSRRKSTAKAKKTKPASSLRMTATDELHSQSLLAEG